MQALRGAGIRDYAAAEGEMRLLEIEEGEAEGAGGEADRLPMVYDPQALKDYFARRPQVRVYILVARLHSWWGIDSAARGRREGGDGVVSGSCPARVLSVCCKFECIVFWRRLHRI